MMNILVSNFSTAWEDNTLLDLFAPYAKADQARIMMDGFTGLSRGFGYVEIADEKAAQTAIDALNGKEIDGLRLEVSEVSPAFVNKGSYKTRTANQ